MDAEVPKYLPYIFRSFQGFRTTDVREFHQTRQMELVLESEPDRVRLCSRCGHQLGEVHDRYRVRARHLKAFNWNVVVVFYREKRH